LARDQQRSEVAVADITIQGFIGASDAISQSFLATTYPALANAVATPVYLVAILYWALFGYQVYAGHSPLQWKDFLAKAALTSLVFATLSWGGLAQTIYQVFFTFADSAASTIMAGKPTGQMIDALWSNADAVSRTLRNVSITQITFILEGFLLLVVNSILFVIAIAYMTIAKFGLAVTMVLLPLFVGFSFFGETRQWARNWINMMLTFCFMYILVVAVVRFGFVAFGAAIEGAEKSASLPLPFAPGVPSLNSGQSSQLVILEGVLILFMLGIRGWASALAGGTASSTGMLVMIARTVATKSLR
jgi:type IV secretion system protein VirB6